MEVIPAIDILEGRAVRLIRGSYDSPVVYGDPLAWAQKWIAMGASRLHVVDLEAARTGNPVHIDLVLKIKDLGVPVQFGGGIRNRKAAEELLALGIDRIMVGTAFWEEPESFASLGDRVIPALDLRGRRLAVSGWTREGLSLGKAFDILERSGIQRALLTAVMRDGTLRGPDLDLVVSVARRGIRLIVAGGIGCRDDLDALSGIPGVEAAVVGKALYEGTIKEALPCWPRG